MATSGILHHTFTASQALTGSAARVAASSPAAASTNGTSSASSSDSSADSATISANDFLTLLVTEMQNQDPTADTDPNEYIDQLVQVNSLEQLISINQTLTTDLGGATSTSSSSSGSGQSADAAKNLNPSAAPGTAANVTQKNNLLAALETAAGAQGTTSASAGRAAGSFSIPAANPAAQRVARALDGRQQKVSGVIPPGTWAK